MKILIIGVSGFVGSNLTERLLETTDYEVYGIDINRSYVEEFIEHERFHFIEGDIFDHLEWIEDHIKNCDIVFPLVAIATPKLYIDQPLRVFELDFEHNLQIIRWANKHKCRLIFPSSSEVYGMSSDEEFNEETTNFVYGPTHKVRWIYAGIKELLDRIIYAYGRDEGLRYTCFRPFNWIGPRLDSVESARVSHSRVLTQFITDLLCGNPIRLVEGGQQVRCFTDIEDSLDCLMSIIENEATANRRIINIGNPDNVSSIADLAKSTRSIYARIKGVDEINLPPIETVDENEFYGEGYQDISYRVPNIDLAKKLFGWNPAVPLETSIDHSIDFLIKQGKAPVINGNG